MVFWGVITVFCALFSLIYELLSHHIYSVFMVGLCLIPFLSGFVPVLVHKIKNWQLPDRTTLRLHFWSTMTLTLGSLMTGIFDIYGTVSELTKYYWIVGITLLIVTVVSYGVNYLKREQVENRKNVDNREIFHTRQNYQGAVQWHR